MQNIHVFNNLLRKEQDMGRLTYKKAGVDIDEGERFVKRISPMVRKTFRREVITDVGSFSALFKIDLSRYKEPVLVSGTDGVGTKLKIAFLMDKHDTVGIDLVAMCVNDILTSGAEPLFFLDYLAMGKLRSERASKIIKGIVYGCKKAGCSLIGGETAEMPGFYSEGEYDLSGFAVGVVDKGRIIDGTNIKDGDVIIGIASNGLHSNGYSLVRRLFLDIKKMDIRAYVSDFKGTLGEELLKPTRIYAKAFLNLMDKIEIKGMAHITGGGMPGNIPRILPRGMAAHIKAGSWPVPGIFRFIEKAGKISEKEMKKTFNMGIGYVMVVAVENSKKAVLLLKKYGYQPYIIGNIKKGARGVRYYS
jgi:phosphoribosylformylglycinamidine cyclo-ligase